MSDPLQRACVTLRIIGDDLAPDELTALLGVQPEIGVRKHESYVTRHSGRVRRAETGLWMLGTGYREPPDIDEQITELIGRMSPRLEIWNDLSTKFDCEVSVGVYFKDGSWTGGILLQPHTLRLLGERDLSIDFDMYAPGAST